MSLLQVHVVVACTGGKTVVPPNDLRMRQYREGDVSARAAAWIAALRANSAPPVKAFELYKGDHWLVARSIALHPPAGVRPVVWVCSAGYGLVAFNEFILPYAATFAQGHPDSVASGRTGHRGAAGAEAEQWWGLLAAEWRRNPRRTGPFSVAELAAEGSETPILVAGSSHYIRAMAGDLAAARDQLRSPDLLSVFSASLGELDPLTAHLIPLHGGFQAPDGDGGTRLLAGAYPSLNVRALRLALESAAGTELRHSVLRDLFGQLARSAPPAALLVRRRVAISEAESFVRERLTADPGLGHSRLIREFRASGRAFEYKRFQALVGRVRTQIASADSAGLVGVGQGGA